MCAWALAPVCDGPPVRGSRRGSQPAKRGRTRGISGRESGPAGWPGRVRPEPVPELARAGCPLLSRNTRNSARRCWGFRWFGTRNSRLRVPGWRTPETPVRIDLFRVFRVRRGGSWPPSRGVADQPVPLRLQVPEPRPQEGVQLALQPRDHLPGLRVDALVDGRDRLLEAESASSSPGRPSRGGNTRTTISGSWQRSPCASK